MNTSIEEQAPDQFNPQGEFIKCPALFSFGEFLLVVFSQDRTSMGYCRNYTSIVRVGLEDVPESE